VVHGFLGGARVLLWCMDTYHEVHVHPSKSGGWVPQEAFPVSHIYPFVEILHGHPHAPRENPCTTPRNPCTER
jgi:hypothetical protein